LIRKARGTFAALKALEFQQHYTQKKAANLPGRFSKRRPQLKSTAAAKPPSRA
jgi:hypothetical protein